MDAASSFLCFGMVEACQLYDKTSTFGVGVMAGLSALYTTIMATPLPLKPDPPHAEGTDFHKGGCWGCKIH